MRALISLVSSEKGSCMSARIGLGRRRGFTLVELLVVIAIIGVLMGLLLPAVQKVREAANRAKCSNNLKQMGIATHMAHDTYETLPPQVGAYPRSSTNSWGTAQFHLLPFIEQGAFHDSMLGGSPSAYDTYNNNFGWNGSSYLYIAAVKMYSCPSDPSASNGLSANAGGNWGAGNYAANFNVFAQNGVTWQFYARIPASFPDGTSNTILYAEKYAACGDHGSLWPWYSNNARNWPNNYWGPFFAVFPWSGEGVGKGIKFQIQPNPWQSACNYNLASSPHPVINVGMADGSVQSLSASLDPNVWWYLCTPAGGEVIPAY
jgi:prepilin-type N-terminal cleavage/methylation domain-containing protein